MVQAVLALHPEVKVSIRYIEPKPFLRYFQDLLAWSQTGKLQLVYVSLQSGSQRVLSAMRRGYDIHEVTDALQTFRSKASTILYGNWLVGFPGEQEDDFRATVELARELNFHINVAIPFSPRPNTPASGMASQVEASVLASRVDVLNDAAADLKVELMRPHMEVLDPVRREAVLDLIRKAERQQYAMPSSPVRAAIPLVLKNA